MCRRIAVVSSTAFIVAIACHSYAAVIYSTPGSTYLQNFDTLPNTPQNASLGASPAGWTDDNSSPGAGNFSIVGWHFISSDFAIGRWCERASADAYRCRHRLILARS